MDFTGRVLDGRYRLTGKLARGGMATVWTGVDERLDRPVAVKVMHPWLAEDPAFVARFTQEARSAARLTAPEVVAVHDTGRDDETGAAYLVMELVRGRDLRNLLQERGALPPARALPIAESVLRALAAAHRAGLVHRDVKPENVLLADDGRVKVADFGLARAVETSQVTSTTGQLIGTVAYLAPELVVDGTVDPRTDVYAAGVLLWELLTGSQPHAGDAPLTVAYRHVNEDVPPPSTLVAGLPPALDELVVRATRRDPALRPPDAGALLAELLAVPGARGAPAQRQDTLVVPRPAEAPPAPAPGATAGSLRLPAARTDTPVPEPVRRRRGPSRGLLAFLAVLLVAAGAGVASWSVAAARWTTAPAVLALPQAQATERLRAAGLVVEQAPAEFDEALPAGVVLDQTPDPNGRVRKGGTVTLVLSRGPDRRRVPALSGRTLSAARAALDDVGLETGRVTEQFSTEQPEGRVLRSDPASGSPLRPGAAVSLVVSKGVEQLPVPDVTGRGRTAAVAALEQAGFEASVQEAFDEQVAAGIVLSTDPDGGRAPRGAAVTLTVSKGPDLVTVPDLRGLTREEADALLEDDDLEGQAFDLPDGSGSVVTQSPAAGEQVRRGTTVTYYVL